jgi:hypothetical protein
MKWKLTMGLLAVAIGFGGSCLAAEAQATVVIHAGQLFDGKSELLASKQVIVIQICAPLCRNAGRCAKSC